MKPKSFALQNESRKNVKVAVIGAGPAGLAAALSLQKAGVSVHVYEAQAHVGGLCRSFSLWGHLVDLGPHRFFSSDETVLRLWFQTVGTAYSWVPRQTRIFYNGKYFSYPLEFWNTILNLGLRDSLLSLISYMRQKFSWKKKQDHFESWVIRRFGVHLYRIFFKDYSEKLWGLPCHQIDADFAYRKIRGLSALSVFKNHFRKKDTFVDTFAYPHAGTGSVYQTLKEQLIKSGGHVHLEDPVRGLTQKSNGTYQLNTKTDTTVFDYVISTMPMTSLVKQLPKVPETVRVAADALSFRNTILVYLHVDAKNLFPDNWIYVHSKDVKFGRVTNFSNWSIPINDTAPGTVLCLEYWCSDEDPLWGRGDGDILELAKRELRQLQLTLDTVVILDGYVVRVPKSYPVLKRGYAEHVAVIRNYLQAQYPKLFLIGRYGAFKYNNQDHSLLMGLRAAEHILSNHQSLRDDVNNSHNYEEDVHLSDVLFDRFDEV